MNNNIPAFPLVEPSTPCAVNEGMYLRDYFAGQALAGWRADPDYTVVSHEIVARDCYEMADAMIKQRGKYD